MARVPSEPTGGLPFKEDPAGGDADGRAHDPDTLVVNLDGFDGPIDVLLTLARDQKVDLSRLSILDLAEQYLAFVRAARERNLDLAAGYLVMAAWLAFLKSRLLLPVPQADDEPSGAEMAAALQFQLQRLEAMRTAGQALIERPRLGRTTFPRGAPEPVNVLRQTVFNASLRDLLRAYADLHHRRTRNPALSVEPFDLYSVDEALSRLSGLLGTAMDWTALARFLPDDLTSTGSAPELLRRSAVSAMFVAGLELARQGRLDLRQEGGAFSPLYLRRKEG